LALTPCVIRFPSEREAFSPFNVPNKRQATYTFTHHRD